MIVPTLEDLLVLRGTARGWSLRAQTAARATLLGAHRSSFRGRGLEFQEVRPYVPGDDPRSIDWRVTARRGRPHTKLFQEERERPVWLLVDLHAGLFFGTRRQLKSAVALRAAALLAWTASMGGDRVGAVIAGAASGKGAAPPRVLPPRAREAGVLPILETLIELQPTAPAAPASGSLHGALLSLAPLVHPGSLVAVLSDFASLDAGSDVLWSKIAAHSEFRLFWITDSLEEQGLPNGFFRGGVPNELRIVDGAKARAAWLAAWREREARLDALARRHRMPAVRLDTADSTEELLRPLLRGPKAAA
ncbi:MAG TPA: DUF58 domain-containing protein [Steroidobacteraceae bacterium]|nr:DUF58 domain-containing protein [Steroidobacteraceae bacterium]